MNMKTSDQQLVANYLNGDQKALEILIKRYLKPIYIFAYHHTKGQKEVAEDLTQEIFLKMWKNLKRYDHQKSFKNWLFTIAKNTLIDHLRKNKRTISLLETFAQSKESFEKVFDTTLTLKEAIQKLSPKYRQVLDLYYWQGFNFKEIAEILKEPINTVKSRHHRAIIILRKHIYFDE